MPIIGKGKLEKGKYWRNLREEKKKRREERARKNNIMVIRVIQRKNTRITNKELYAEGHMCVCVCVSACTALTAHFAMSSIFLG